MNSETWATVDKQVFQANVNLVSKALPGQTQSTHETENPYSLQEIV